MIKEEIQKFLEIQIHQSRVDYNIIETHDAPKFQRHLIRYLGSEKDEIKAYLFIPKKEEIKGGILVHHQHNGERHLGKSEVAGLVGDPFMFFCPALADAGIICLAPDSICFEDRRKNKKGFEPDENPDIDWLQHYNEMSYRLLKGTTLMKKVIEDSSIAMSLLLQQEGLNHTNKDKVGVLGHSYGGNTVIFHSPFDERIKYACSSGAVCTYQTKFENNTGIEMAEVIPHFYTKYDIDDLLKLVHPREFLIVSSTEDKYTQDASDIYASIQSDFPDSKEKNFISHQRFEGKHALNQERFDFILNWFLQKFEE